MNYWVSTDLDGTLLDHTTYSFEQAQVGIDTCKQHGIPILLNTSKTTAETLVLADKLNFQSPIIVENGSALVLPKQLSEVSSNQMLYGKQCLKTADGYVRFNFGVERKAILQFIKEVRSSKSWKFEGFNDWSLDQIQQHTGLSIDDASRAAAKEYSEPFIWQDSKENLSLFEIMAAKRGLSMLKGGRFHHLQGRCSKATPLAWLKENPEMLTYIGNQASESPTLIALGDNHNDIAMLNEADIPVCIKTPNGAHPKIKPHSRAYYTTSVGPAGWTEAILHIINANRQL